MKLTKLTAKLMLVWCIRCEWCSAKLWAKPMLAIIASWTSYVVKGYIYVKD